MTLRVFWRTLFVSLVLIVPFGIYLAPHTMAAVFSVIVALAPVWLPLLLLVVAVPLWIAYVRSQYVFNVPYTTLELKPGEATPQSARAMELVFYSLHHRTSIPRVKELLLGEMRLPWSFEISASAGTVRFFMHIPKSHRQAIELRIRSEYRDVDIDEIRDYAREERFDPITMKLAVREYALGKPDPYPIKTYDVHEAEKKPHNPFNEFLEDLVGVGDNERLYFSITVRPHQRERKRFWEQEEDTLHSDAHREISKILGPGGDLRSVPEGRQTLVAAIEQALKKPAFDCGIRAIYFADRQHFNQSRADGLDTLLNRFSDTELNEFKTYNPRSVVAWPLSDLFAALPWMYEMYVHQLYRRRSFFVPPYYGSPFVLNTAELATIFHLPHITRASALARGSGRRLEPPTNLPV